MSGEFFLLVLSITLALILGGVVLAFLLKRRQTPEEKANQLRRDQNLPDRDAPDGEDGVSGRKDTPERSVKRSYVSLSEALEPTRRNFWDRITRSLSASDRGHTELEELEEALYLSDLGPQTVQKLLEGLKDRLNGSGTLAVAPLREALRQEILSIFLKVSDQRHKIDPPSSSPHVVMVVGVNGAGKTTTIGKLAGQWADSGKKVLLAAGDTFRAAADSQLKVWQERADVEIFSPPNVKDPAAVVFDALKMAQARGFDVVLVDTAGRLHTQANLMEELKKVKRVMAKVINDAPHETILVLDGSSGQNALAQAKEFHQKLGITGVALTKMDGTAKGGVAVAVAYEIQVPILWIGTGEGISDLRAFSSEEYVESII